MLSWQTFGGLTMTVQRFKQLSPLLVGNFANNSEDKTNLAFRATVQSEVEFVHEVTAAVTARIYPNQKQGCISCGPCSYPELTEDHVLPSA